MNKYLIITGAAAVLLSACATAPAGLAPTGTLSLPSISIPSEWEKAGRPEDKPEHAAGWLNRFNDTELNDLVVQAFAHNPNLKRLQARLEQAKAQSNKARSALLPVLRASAGGSRTESFDSSDNSTANLNIGLDVSWEPDLWGRIEASSNANENRAEAAQEDYKAARQVLAASVIENYFLAIEARRLAEVSKSNLDALNKTLGFVTVQYDRGLRSGQDISLIRADVASAKVSFNRTEGAARNALRALNILMGSYPQTERLLSATLPDVPKFTVLGQPANILTQRPDLRAAQYRVRAAYSAHKSTKAAQNPNLSLGGIIGGNSSALGNVFDPSAMASTLFANLTAPIFDGGARKADIAIARADIDESLASYQEAALSAFSEVERQIDEEQILAQQEIELTQALSDARDALRFTQFRYESGESDLLNVLSVQQRVSFIEGQLVSTRRARLVQYLNLALSLGDEPITKNGYKLPSTRTEQRSYLGFTSL